MDNEPNMYDVPQEPVRTGTEKVKYALSQAPKKLFSIVQSIVLLGAFLVILYLLLITPHQVDGRSMFPTYQNEEYLIANKVIYKFSKPDRGDVIIFKFSATRDFIKRVIGISGDSISLQNGKYIVNNQILDESEYLSSTIYTEGGQFLGEGQTIIVPEGEVFVSGDNRPHSSDSRSFGTIKLEQIKGKVWFVFLPVEDFRIIKDPAYNVN